MLVDNRKWYQRKWCQEGFKEGDILTMAIR